jgi:hypothetical protein
MVQLIPEPGNVFMAQTGPKTRTAFVLITSKNHDWLAQMDRAINRALYQFKSLIFLILGTPGVLCGFYGAYQGFVLQYFGTASPAVLTDLNHTYAYYTYKLDDGTPENSSCRLTEEFFRSHRVGDSVNIVYLSDQPYVSELAGSDAMLQDGLLEMFAGFVVALIGIIRLFLLFQSGSIKAVRR